MDDIYDNLDSYNDISNFENLKSENTDLKHKLEECKTALSQLQKAILQDFDNLTCQHQRLQQNYSSLLKTAKAEVERKTQMIANINTEKDEIYLRLLQEKNNKTSYHNQLKLNKGNPQQDKRPEFSNDKIDSKKENPGKNRENVPDRRENEQDSRREIPDSSRRTTNKENQRSNIESQPCSISRRRKSCTSLRQDLHKFSSDDEDDKQLSNNSTPTLRSLQAREEDHTTKHRDCKLNQPQSAEQFPLSNKSDNRDSPRDEPRWRRGSAERDRNDRYSDRNKYNEWRSRDTRENRWQHRSSERYRQSDDLRRKLNRSPPRFMRQRNRSRDRRYYEKERFDYEHQHHYERHPPLYHDRQPMKHKLHAEVEEPDYKRRRTEYDNPEELTEQVHRRPEICYPVYHSCQSPDEIHVEHAATKEPIKEISYTAKMPLDDPRKTSHRYIPDGEGENKVWVAGSGRLTEFRKVGPWADTPPDKHSVRAVTTHTPVNRTETTGSNHGPWRQTIPDRSDPQRQSTGDRPNTCRETIRQDIPAPRKNTADDKPNFKETTADKQNTCRETIAERSAPWRETTEYKPGHCKEITANKASPYTWMITDESDLSYEAVSVGSATETNVDISDSCILKNDDKSQEKLSSKPQEDSHLIGQVYMDIDKVSPKICSELGQIHDIISDTELEPSHDMRQSKKSSDPQKGLKSVVKVPELFPSTSNEFLKKYKISKKSKSSTDVTDSCQNKLPESDNCVESIEEKSAAELAKLQETLLKQIALEESKHVSNKTENKHKNNIDNVDKLTSKKNKVKVGSNSKPELTKTARQSKQASNGPTTKSDAFMEEKEGHSSSPLETLLNEIPSRDSKNSDHKTSKKLKTVKINKADNTNKSETSTKLDPFKEKTPKNSEHTDIANETKKNDDLPVNQGHSIKPHCVETNSNAVKGSLKGENQRSIKNKLDKSGKFRQTKQSSGNSKYVGSSDFDENKNSSSIPKPLDHIVKQNTGTDTDGITNTSTLANLDNESKLVSKTITAASNSLNINPIEACPISSPKRGFVVGDLELSDESSDGNEDPCDQASKKDVFYSDKDKRCKSKCYEESNNVKQNVKLNENPKGIEKTKEINAKICDLFGETSLLTPEDLDIQSHKIPDPCPDGILSNDDSSATDMWKITKTPIEIEKYSKEPETIPLERENLNKDKKDHKSLKKREKIPETVKHTSIHKNKKSKEDHNIVKSNICEDIDGYKNIDDDKIKFQKISHNVDTRTSVDKESLDSSEAIRVIPVNDEPDIYKTVVISSGQQAQSITEPVDDSKDNKTCFQLVQKEDNINELTSFVTSTPLRVDQHKDVSRVTEGNTSNSMSDATPNGSSQTSTAEVPDVRVMLKGRRKRIIK